MSPEHTSAPHRFEIRLGEQVTLRQGRRSAAQAALQLSRRRRGRDVHVVRADGKVEMTFRSGRLRHFRHRVR